jgi:hypothetical protein
LRARCAITLRLIRTLPAGTRRTIPTRLAIHAFAARAVREALSLLIARDLEAVARILVLSARAPLLPAPLARRRGALPLLPLRELGGLLGRPQLAARKPHHLGVGMLRLQLLQRRQQLLFRRGAKRRGVAVGDDRPVHVTRRHGQAF